MPQIAQYLKSPVIFSDNTLPVFNPNDPWIDAGTEFLYDFGRQACWPSQVAPVVGNQPINLVTGTSSGSGFQIGSGIGFREGGLDFKATGSGGGGTADILYLGGVDDFRLESSGSADFYDIVWIKRETGYATTNYQNIMGRSATVTTAAVNERRITTGVNGESIFLGVVMRNTDGNLANYNYTIANSVLAPLLNTTIQLAMAVEAGRCKFFLNGVKVNDVASGNKPFNSPAGQRMYSAAGIGGGAFKGIYKRSSFSRLGFGKTAEERILDDWNKNHVRLNTV